MVDYPLWICLSLVFRKFNRSVGLESGIISTRLRQRSVTNYSAAIAGQVQQLQLQLHLELIESQQIGTERYSRAVEGSGTEEPSGQRL